MKVLKFKRRGEFVTMNRGDGRFVARDEMERLLSMMRRQGDCWLWRGRPDKNGYGKFQARDGRTERAHRASWRLHRGDIPDGVFCLHRCDNPPCVNPAHLFLGTQADNIRDMIAKGRRARPNSKITETLAAEIKDRLAAGESGTEISRDVGVSKSIVFSIKYGRTWRDVGTSSTA